MRLQIEAQELGLHWDDVNKVFQVDTEDLAEIWPNVESFISNLRGFVPGQIAYKESSSGTATRGRPRRSRKSGY